MTDHHVTHHRLIAERVDAFRSTGSTERERHRRREAYKRALWTVRGHLQGHHPGVALRPTDTLDDLLARHEACHDDVEEVGECRLAPCDGVPGLVDPPTPTLRQMLAWAEGR